MDQIVCPGCLCQLLDRPACCPVCGCSLDPAQGTDQAELVSRNGIGGSRLPAELLEWARSQINEEELVAGIREVEETGGLELKDFIDELEQEASARE